VATVRFWAGARRAAGADVVTIDAATVKELRSELATRPELTAVVQVATFLVDGVQADDLTSLPAGSLVDVLPPFAGG
jgi:molybdopterin synthase sulfur carrier subunit